jgi:serine/threonine protein kinase
LARAPQRRTGERIGSWTLINCLGMGGNAEVWRASQTVGSNVALKILNARDPNSEPYRRFVSEVAFYLRSDPLPSGVLPTLDSSLPAHPSRENPAWLAMPIAEPIREHLDGVDHRLIAAVTATASVAQALAALAGRNIFHRDIKPENMYLYDGAYAIGDFGLVELPNVDALTEAGKPLGSRYYLAPEMIRDPLRAKGGPADVYSLAKTLWVLSSGQTYPPPVELRSDTELLQLRTYVWHPRVYLLERLLERATAYVPEDRPSMHEMRDELNAWLAEPEQTEVGPPPIDELVSRLVSATTPQRRQSDIQEGWKEQLEEHTRVLSIALEEIIERVTQASRGDILVGPSKWTPPEWGMRALHLGDPNRLVNDLECLEILGAERADVQYSICVGFAFNLDTKGQVQLAAAYWLGHTIEGKAIPQERIWQDSGQAMVGSAQAESLCSRLATGLTRTLSAALALLVRYAEGLDRRVN